VPKSSKNDEMEKIVSIYSLRKGTRIVSFDLEVLKKLKKKPQKMHQNRLRLNN
jgi:uncharacterized protein YjhX (UPF0386 family)